MIQIGIIEYLLIWQFMRRTQRKLPRELAVSGGGGRRKKHTVDINFATDSEHFMLQAVFKRFKIGKWWFNKWRTQIVFYRKTWGQDLNLGTGNLDAELATPKKWLFQALFGILLLNGSEVEIREDEILFVV